MTLGRNVVLWSGNHIGHHSRIRDNVFISSHVVVSGSVEIGEHSFLGVNSCVSNNVRVAPRTFVGANVLVSQDTVERGVYVAPAPKHVPMGSDRFLSMLKIT